MSRERMKQIEAYREETRLLEQAKKTEGKLINGVDVIQKTLASRAAREAVPELVAVTQQARQRPRRT